MASASPPAVRRRWPKWVPIAGWSVLGVLGAAFLAYLATVMFGAVHGIEFCPQTFERRSYSFYELPLIGKQVTATMHEDLTGITETTLKTDKHIAPLGGQKDWHIIIGTRGYRVLRKGDASILVQYLDTKDHDEDLRWVKWSDEHPKLAAVFWPAVQTLARHELYIFMPDLFDVAQSHDDPAKLKQALDEFLADKLLFLARRLQEQEDHVAALTVLDEAAALDPANKEVTRARQTAKVAAKSAAASESGTK